MAQTFGSAQVHVLLRPSKLRYAQIFGSSKASGEDGSIVVGCTELSQVRDLASGDPG